MKQKLKTFNVKQLKDLPLPFIGIDEVGRGCLAGPVCAGVVILNDKFPVKHFLDSKTLTEEKREVLAAEIREYHHWSIGWASVEEIDQINILQATLLAMQRAIMGLKIVPHKVLVDGNQAPKVPYAVETVIQGDDLFVEISAASILAKVYRDQQMHELDRLYPQYGFAQHKGYATKQHLQALREYGPIAAHRRSFSPVAEMAAAISS